MSPAGAQQLRLLARAGLTTSSAVVEDGVATARLEQLLGATVDRPVRAVPAPGLTLGGAVQAAFWRTAAVELAVDWTATELVAEEGGEDRAIQDLGVLQVMLGGAWSPRARVELGGGAGVVRYVTDERGIFANGADPSLAAEVRLGWTPPLPGDRLTLLAGAHMHRFGTDAIRQAGGVDGVVTRLSLMGRVRLAEVGL
ncbi:MAG TPA: hypothetical protein VK928_10205 [Longimicrobiales bacterium]|nr:hypothetical protein [Longimicrobiales bacterium]